MNSSRGSSPGGARLGGEPPRMDVVHAVAERLTRFRLRAGLELEAAARAAAVEPERLAGAEQGAVVLCEPELDALARVYGVEATEIFGGRITPLQDYAGGA